MNALTLICQTIITLAELVFIAILFIAILFIVLTRCFYYGVLLLVIVIYKKLIKK